jgi:hypothetical protein
MDTSPAIWDLQFELYRRLTDTQRLENARQMTLSMQHSLFALVRAQHPDLTDDEIWLKLAVRRLGKDVVRKVTGREIDPS